MSGNFAPRSSGEDPEFGHGTLSTRIGLLKVRAAAEMSFPGMG
jgi:hypothetical protein